MMEDVDRNDDAASSAERHPFDVASRVADDGLNRPDGRIEIVAEPVRYRRGPVYGLVAAALLPALALFAVYRWSDGEADRYEIELDWLDAERQGVVDTANVLSSAPTTIAAESAAGAGEVDNAESNSAVPETGLMSYRRMPTAVAALANARSLSSNLSDFSSRLDPGVCFSASLDGIRVSAHGSGVPFIPGSVQKLVTAAVALDVLGPDYVFETSVAVPQVIDGEVEGDIYLIGGGDPLLRSDDFPSSDDNRPAFHTTSLDALADAVAQDGVKRVRGAVIGDGTRYDDEFAVDSWASGVAGVDAGPYDALMVNDARVLGRGSRESDPNSAAAREFVRLLVERDVRVDGGWGSGSRSTLVPVTQTATSAPVDDIVEEMLVNSNNNTAEMLLKEIGFVALGEGSRAAGLQVARQWLVSNGISTLGVELADGSGLSNENALTCDVVVAVLQAVDEEGVMKSLPIAGRTGTLNGEFTESPLSGVLRAKTGTLNVGSVEPPAVKALAGYVPDPAGTIQFALIANTPGAASEQYYRALWNALAERFASHPAGPGIDDLGPLGLAAD